MLVELEAANNFLLADVEQGDYEGALGPSHDGETTAEVGVLVVALLGKQDVGKRLLDVLEIKDDTMALGQHLVDEVTLLADHLAAEAEA